VGGGLSRATSREAGSIDAMFRRGRGSLEYSKRASVTSNQQRTRSLHYYLARQCLSAIPDLNEKVIDVSSVIVHFENWMAEYLGGRFIKLSKGEKWLFFRCVNRFMRAYKRKIWRRLEFFDKIEWGLKLEFTLDPKRFMRLKDEFQIISKGWSKLRSWLLKRYGKFQFLKVLEIQKSGRPHLHVLISGIYFVNHTELSAIWDKYGGGHVWLRSVYGDINAIWYVLKYVNKTVLGNDKVYSALLFASNRRMFSLSGGLMGLLNIRRFRKNQGWTFEGSVAEAYVKEFCEEEGIPFDDMILVDVKPEFERDYPLLCPVFEDT